jgi:DNA replication protein DnaC
MDIKTSQHKRIMRYYEEKRLQSHYALNKRKEKVYQVIPEIKSIDEQISRTSIELSKALILNNTDQETTIKQIKEKNLELSMKKIELLHMHGFSKDYLQKTYDCPKCEDTGYIKNEKCQCFKQAIIDLAYEQSNIKTILEEENFNTFSFEFYSDEVNPEYGVSPRKNIRNIYHHCQEFVQNFAHNKQNMIFYGNAGVGKSFLSNCIAKAILDKGFIVIYLTAFQLFEVFEKHKFNKANNEIYEDLVEDIFNCDLLIIDDLGTEFNTSLTGPQLFNCLNTRLLNKKSTIISTNLTPSQWSKQYSTRIVSRIFGYYEPLNIFGEDIRIKKAFH